MSSTIETLSLCVVLACTPVNSVMPHTYLILSYIIFSLIGVKALVTLSVMSVLGRKLLDPIFYFVAKSSSHEAFLSIILTTVLLMSFVTQGEALARSMLSMY